MRKSNSPKPKTSTVDDPKKVLGNLKVSQVVKLDPDLANLTPSNATPKIR